MFPVLSEYYVKRTSMPEFLNRLDENPGSVSLSAYFPPGLTEDDVRKMALPVLPERIIGEIVGSVVGAAVFTGNEQSYFVLPPFPLKEKVVFTGCITEPLCEMITRDFHIGLVLVHLGTYAVGVCRGDILVSSKVGTGLVHGRTRKGKRVPRKGVRSRSGTSWTLRKNTGLSRLRRTSPDRASASERMPVPEIVR
jgi:hypothetical protein